MSGEMLMMIERWRRRTGDEHEKKRKDGLRTIRNDIGRVRQRAGKGPNLFD